MTDLVSTAVAALDRVDPTVTWADVEERLDQPAVMPMKADDGGDPTRRSARPMWMVAAAVLVVLAIAVGLLVESRVGVEQRPTVTSQPPVTYDPTMLDPRSEGYVSPYQAEHATGWLADYDPAEIAYLQAEDGSASDYSLVTTLEFRRACRELARARDVAGASSAADRAAAVEAIATPEIARLHDRDDPQSAGVTDYWRTLFADVAAGGSSAVDRWLGPDCADALTWHP